MTVDKFYKHISKHKTQDVDLNEIKRQVLESIQQSSSTGLDSVDLENVKKRTLENERVITNVKKK